MKHSIKIVTLAILLAVAGTALAQQAPYYNGRQYTPNFNTDPYGANAQAQAQQEAIEQERAYQAQQLAQQERYLQQEQRDANEAQLLQALRSAPTAQPSQPAQSSSYSRYCYIDYSGHMYCTQ